MLYLISSNHSLPKHMLSGKLYTDQAFTHQSRTITFLDLMVGIKGTLYITQGNKEYTLTPGKFLLLLPGIEHHGYKTSTEELSYFWCHFSLQENYNLVEKESVAMHLAQITKGRPYGSRGSNEKFKDLYVIPEYGELNNPDRVNLLFSQLNAYSVKKNYTPLFEDCSLSLIMAELTQMTLRHLNVLNQEYSAGKRNLTEVTAWVRINCRRNLTVNDVAKQFGYNPDYLSTAIRKMTGYPLLQYIRMCQIAIAKQLLLTTHLRVKEIAHDVGFMDENYFMKLFKEHEGVSPSRYRNAYTESYMSNQ